MCIFHIFFVSKIKTLTFGKQHKFVIIDPNCLIPTNKIVVIPLSAFNCQLPLYHKVAVCIKWISPRLSFPFNPNVMSNEVVDLQNHVAFLEVSLWCHLVFLDWLGQKSEPPSRLHKEESCILYCPTTCFSFYLS